MITIHILVTILNTCGLDESNLFSNHEILNFTISFI